MAHTGPLGLVEKIILLSLGPGYPRTVHFTLLAYALKLLDEAISLVSRYNEIRPKNMEKMSSAGGLPQSLNGPDNSQLNLSMVTVNSI